MTGSAAAPDRPEPAVTAEVRDTGALEGRRLGEICRCGHARDAHQHFRRGQDCGVCGAQLCPRYRSRSGRSMVRLGRDLLGRALARRRG